MMANSPIGTLLSPKPASELYEVDPRYNYHARVPSSFSFEPRKHKRRFTAPRGKLKDCTHVHRKDVPKSFSLSVKEREDLVAVDIETAPCDFNKEQYWETTPIQAIGLYAPNLEEIAVVSIEEGQQPPENLLSVLSDEEVQKLFHYGRFDARFLRYHFGADILNYACTCIASRILTPGVQSHSLKSLVQKHFEIDLNKDIATSGFETPLSQEEVLYIAKDVVYLPVLLKELFHPETKEWDRDQMAAHEARLGLVQKAFEALPLHVELDINGIKNAI